MRQVSSTRRTVGKGEMSIPGTRHIKSVVKALDILELVSNSPRGMTLYHLSRALSLPKQTVHGLVTTLIHREYLGKIGPPVRYVLGPMMGMLQHRQSSWNQRVLYRAVPKAIHISNELAASVMVVQYTAGEMVGRFFCAPGQEARLEYHSPVAEYGCSVVAQAFLDGNELVAYRARHRFTDADLEYWHSPELLEQLYPLVRKDRLVAFVKSGLLRVAAAIPNSDGSPTAFMALTKPFGELAYLEAQVCVDAVREAGKSVSDAVDQSAE